MKISKPINTKVKSLRSNSNNTKALAIAISIIVFASLGTYLLFFSQAATSLKADFNTDNTVGIKDLSILASNWGRTNATSAQGDANADKVVNVYDLNILASEWGQTITPTTTPTPTPTSPTPTPTTTTPPPTTGTVVNVSPSSNLQSAIDGLGTNGGTIKFAAGTYNLGSPLRLPAGNKAMMTLDGSAGVTINLTGSPPKFLVWNKTAANQTFRYFRISGFQINGMNKVGSITSTSLIGDTTSGWATDINVEYVTVENCRLYGALEMKGINIYSGQGDSVSNHITDITVTNNNLVGVNHGVTIWATRESNGADQVWLDNIIIRNNWTDTTRTAAGPISNYHVGQYGIVGKTELTGNYGANTGDNCIEINNSTYALIENNTCVNPLWWNTYYANYSAPPATQTFITRGNKTITNRVTPSGGNYGYGIGNSGYQMPNATFTYENNSYELTSAITGGDHRAFATHTVTAKSLTINGLTVTHKTGLSPSFFVDVSGLTATKNISNVTVNGAKLY